MTELLDYYTLLGVQRTATEPQILQAYRQLALRYHPDLHPGDHAAVDRFKQVTEAFEVLGDPDKRRQYDEACRREQEAAVATPPAPVSSRVSRGATFGDLFARRSSHSPR